MLELYIKLVEKRKRTIESVPVEYRESVRKEMENKGKK